MPKTLEGLSVSELDQLIERAQSVRKETRDRRRHELKAEIETKLKDEGFTAIEVLGGKLKPKPETLPPKYADPSDSIRTWSGKGRTPGWLQAKFDAGARLEDFIIKT
jgi:DNA-binding protein H-NS